MSDQESNGTSSADGPGEAVLDEPTEHALDPAADPNTEWEQRAADQISERSNGQDGSNGQEVDESSEDSA